VNDESTGALHCVYKHTFPNGKVYVGQTCSGKTEDRWQGGKGYQGQFVFDAIVRYGWNNVRSEILEDDISADEINEREAFYIRKFHAADRAYGYNVSHGSKQGRVEREVVQAPSGPVLVRTESESKKDGQEPLMMKLRPASEKYGLSYDRLRKMCLAGEVANIKSGRDWLVNTRALNDILTGKGITA